MKKEVIYDGKILKLSVKKKRLPNGNIALIEAIEHKGAVLIIPLLPKDKIIFIRQFRPVISEYIWELPAGTLNKDEKPLACAKREILEEIGYSAKSWNKIGCIYPAPGYTTEKIYIYLAYDLIKGEHDRDPDEIIKTRIFTYTDLKRMLRNKKIVDSKTISALSLWGGLDGKKGGRCLEKR